MSLFSAQLDIEFIYYYSPDGVQYPLFGGKRALMRFTGLEMPEINYLSDSGPFIHGSRIRDFRLSDRILEFTQYERSCSRQERWDNLGLMIDSFRMNRGGIGRILIVLPDGTEREIDTYILSGPRGDYVADGGLSSWDLQEVLRFIAPYPIFRDPNENENIFPGTIEDTCLPTCLDTCIGSAVINATIDITYPGTFETFPIITLTGSIDTPIISNQTTGKEIKLLYDIGLGEIVTIELTPDQALVYNNYGQNLIGTVEDTNDLATFSIEPEGLYVPGGVNTILVQGSGGTLGTTQIAINYHDQYLGVPK